MGKLLLVLVAVAAATCVGTEDLALRGAPQAAPDIAFEVASVRPAAPNNRTQLSFPPGRFNAKSTTLKNLIVIAYDVREFQISGGPPWINSNRYDIAASSEKPFPTRNEMEMMIRTLLEDRFKLAAREESHEMPVYALIVAKNGFKMHESGEDKTLSLDGGPGRAAGTKVTMELFSQFLSQQLSRGVVDHTGLTGLYDVELSWTPDVNQDRSSTDGTLPAELSAPSLFTA